MAFLTQGKAVTADAPAEDAAAPLCMIDPTRPGTGFYPRPGAAFVVSRLRARSTGFVIDGYTLRYYNLNGEIE